MTDARNSAWSRRRRGPRWDPVGAADPIYRPTPAWYRLCIALNCGGVESEAGSRQLEHKSVGRRKAVQRGRENMRRHIIRSVVTAAAILCSDIAFAAIAPSKLGRFVSQVWSTADVRSDDALVRSLRQTGLVKPDAPDDKLLAVLESARREHSANTATGWSFSSPEERVRVLLEPYLTDKGRRWAVPLESLDLPDY